MAYTSANLPNGGRTQYFNLQYDDSLSADRGVGLATEIMQHCDADLALLASWFSGRRLDMSPPIIVSLPNVTTAGGASWRGFGALPLQVTLSMGDVPMATGTPIMLARYLLFSEVSEMYMRAFAPYLFNPWFATGEGSKGEGLSRFLATKFLLREYPAATAIPAQAGATFGVSSLWLNSVRNNHIDDNIDDIQPDDITGCAALFLYFLHDQLGFSIEQIIDAGGGRLSNVYENLTQDSWTSAWTKFRPLVDAHYPNAVDANGVTTPQYFPPFDTVFPVSDLTRLTVPREVSWVGLTGWNSIGVSVDRAAQLRLNVSITSDDLSIIPSFTMTIERQTTYSSAVVPVIPQPANFAPKMVNVTASYAGKSISQSINVVRPEQLTLRPLYITSAAAADRCKASCVEFTSQTFSILSLGVLATAPNLVYAWTVTNAMAVNVTAPELTIASLPVAGTEVTVSVTVRSNQGLQASGTLTFRTQHAKSELATSLDELRCQLDHFRNANLRIPPWVPVVDRAVLPERIEVLERELQEVTRTMARVNELVKGVKKVIKKREAPKG